MYKHQTQWEDELWIVGLILLFSVWYLYTYDTKADALMHKKNKAYRTTGGQKGNMSLKVICQNASRC